MKDRKCRLWTALSGHQFIIVEVILPENWWRTPVLVEVFGNLPGDDAARILRERPELKDKRIVTWEYAD